jgi:DNA-binding transcriptional regulator GbsR (MarR family)
MEKISELVQEYLAGKPVIDIAKEKGVSRECVYQKLRELPNWGQVKKAVKKNKKQRAIARYPAVFPKVLSLAKNGYSATRISKELNTPIYSIQAMLEGSPFDHSEEARQERDEKIRKEYEEGAFQKDLAEKYDLSQQTISYIIRNG